MVLNWIINYGLVMFAMCLDNIFWISSSPEYDKIKNGNYPIKMEGKEYKNLFDYVFRYRILSVLTDWRDIIPAIISSLLLSITLGGF